MKFIHGKVKDCEKYMGWITGSFFPHDTFNYDKNIEVKVEFYGESASIVRHYHTKRKTWSIVLQGALNLNIEDNPITVKAGEFVIFEPGVTEELTSILPNSIAVHIHTPSVEVDKVEVPIYDK